MSAAKVAPVRVRTHSAKAALAVPAVVAEPLPEPAPAPVPADPPAEPPAAPPVPPIVPSPSLWARFDAWLPRGWKTALAALILVAIGVHFFAMSLSTPLWLVTKLLAGAFVGLVADWMGFPDGRPHLFEKGSDAQQAAWRRRSVIIAGCVVAAGVSA